MNAPTITRHERFTAAGRRGSSASRDPGNGLAPTRRERARNPGATRKLTGNRCQCLTCGEYFNGVQPFDKHRIGQYASIDQRNTRRCLTVQEMQARGWARNAKGFWTTETRAQRASRHRAAGFQAPRAPSAMQPHCPTRRACETPAPAGSP